MAVVRDAMLLTLSKVGNRHATLQSRRPCDTVEVMLNATVNKLKSTSIALCYLVPADITSIIN